ncbi:MAG: Fe-S protein assembly chaperone HscA [Myxococcota bacterium]|nr:Fe-S protein assembly chaperone HscA [Myxococcota bacterium]
MGLLQIGGGPKEKCAGRVIGIDLGTTYSLVATVKDGNPLVIHDDEGRASLPSVVYFGPDNQIEVGEQARSQAANRSGRTIASAKRFMGRGQQESQSIDELSPYQFATDNEGPVVKFQIATDQAVTPMEVGAEVLKALKLRAEKELDGELDGAVITVPAYFDDAQRQATRDAARLAGLNVLRLLNEPTSAALAYGLDKKKDGIFAVFDMGGGTFDISILKLEDGVFQVLSTGGDSRLGGDDFDRAIAEHFLSESGQDPRTTDSATAALSLHESRLAKERLTTETTTTIKIGGQEFSLSQEQFAEIIQPVIDRVRGPVRRALKDAELKAKELDGVVLVGGSTRVLAVRQYVQEVFGQEPLADIDPDKVVALGAAVQADMLGGSGPRDDVLLLDVLPLSLGIETMGGVVEKLLHRNQTIPASAGQEFTTYADNQTGMDFHIVQGERETVAACRSLARFKLSGIPPMGAGMARVKVLFNVDADGILHVSAEEETTNTRSAIEVKPSYGLDDDTIERMILESIENARTDVSERMLIEKRVDADRILLALKAALKQDEDLLTPDELIELEGGIAALEEAKRNTNHRLIEQRTEQLDKLSVEFAARRMDRSINDALSGKQVKQL